MSWLKVNFHCLFKLLTLQLDREHRHVAHFYQYPDRRIDFCTCGYLKPFNENNQNASGL
jgi:hypothetical protein